MSKENVQLSLKPLSVKVVTAAKILGTSERVVRNLIKAKYIRAMKFPVLVISLAELERFIQNATDKQFDFSEFGNDKFNPESANENIVPLNRKEG